MIGFLTKGGATFSCQLDFSGKEFANFSFFDYSKNTILFHVSLRRHKSLIAHNARRDGKWGKEILVPMEFEGDKHSLEIRFGDPGVGVFLNGKEVSQTGDSFAGLEAVRYVNFVGGVQRGSLRVGGTANADRKGRSKLAIDAPLQVNGWVQDPGLTTQQPVLRASSLDEPLQISVQVDSVMQMLPGGQSAPPLQPSS